MVLRTTCGRDCPDACGILVEVRDGVLSSCRGDPDHPVTRGFLCSQGRDFPQRVHAPDRLQHPMERTPTGWQQVSWAHALDRIAAQLQAVRAAHGPLAVLALRYSGLRGRVQKAMTQVFWSQFGGATTASGGTCVESIDAAHALDFGPHVRTAHPPEDILNSRAIVVWGRNPAVTRQHLIPMLDQARNKGAVVTVIDPLRTATCRRADKHLQLRPGADRFLALAVARWLLEADAIDRSFVAGHTLGFEAFRHACERWSLDELAEIAGVPLKDIAELALTYAERRPVCTLVGLGVGSQIVGAESVRAIDALAALTGNLGIAGAGVSADIEETAGLDDVDIGLPVFPMRRSIRLPRLGHDLLSAADPPLRMAWIAGANPAGTCPEPGRVATALRALDFVVVVEQFMTATAALADLVLPCTTCFEADDLITAYGHDYLGLTRRVMAPVGECRTDGEIFQALAERLGFGAALEGTPHDWMARLLQPLSGAGVTLDALREGAIRNPRAVRVPLSDLKFGTPSGRFEFLSAVTPWKWPTPGELRLLSTKTGRMINLQVLDKDLPDLPVARLHPSTLRATGLRDEDRGWVVSPVGRIEAKLQGDDSLPDGVVLVNPALWKGDLAGVNRLREAILADSGDCAAMHETRVTVERADQASFATTQFGWEGDGGLGERLLSEILRGRKRATCCPIALYDEEEQARIRSTAGRMVTVVDQHGLARGTVRVLEVFETTLGQPDPRLVAGEGYHDAASFRAAHEHVWDDLLTGHGLVLDDDSVLLVELFELVG